MKIDITLRDQAIRLVARKVTGSRSQAEVRVAPLTEEQLTALLAAEQEPAPIVEELLQQFRGVKATEPKIVGRSAVSAALAANQTAPPAPPPDSA